MRHRTRQRALCGAVRGHGLAGAAAARAGGQVIWLVAGPGKPAVSFGTIHSIVGVGPKVGNWPLIPWRIEWHNWEYVTRKQVGE